MTDMSPLGKTPALIPEDAPFSDEQRAWLNGFFSGFIALERAAANGVAAIPALHDQAQADVESDDAPWHDQTLPIAERMTLAKGLPLRRRMMAQQDCGQCGYNCKDYADAVADRQEPRLNLCVPGGKETTRMLTTLNAELDSAPPTGALDIAVQEEVATPSRAARAYGF